MTLIKSISGIRGIIGGRTGNGLTPFDIIRYTIAYAKWALNQDNRGSSSFSKKSIVIGRDSRMSGEMLNNLVSGALVSMGLDVIDIGLATTPTVEIAVKAEEATGGIILTASHNPEQWNALKLLNNRGEFLSADDGNNLLAIADKLEKTIDFPDVYKIGKIDDSKDYAELHIEKVINLPYVNIELIKSKNFRIAIDCINSVGGIIIPGLLRALGVKEIFILNSKPSGRFQHNPEPLAKHLTDLADMVVKEKVQLGFAVDPDVDRLAIINEDGSFFGEEYSLVAVADYLLGIKPGNTVSNLSSSRALKDVTLKHGGKYFASAVGEVNVVEKMKSTNAIIGGEGNGGIILPDLHFGRDALVGIALFLTYLAKKDCKCSELKSQLPGYEMCKKRIDLNPNTDIDKIFDHFILKYKECELNTEDGVKIDFDKKWIHLRKSNTEPIIRIYTEAVTQIEANDLASMFLSEIKQISH